MEVFDDMVCVVTSNKIKIKDSYKIKSRADMAEILYAIQHKHPECEAFKRSYTSLIAEWRTHNRLYRLGYKQHRTRDVDLDYPLKWYFEFAYRILGI